MPFMAMEHESDPRDEIFAQIGKLDGFEVFGNQVLVAIYKRPEKTKSQIILPDAVRKEDEFQGKASCVVKLGPSAFVSDKNYDFAGQKVNVGDWVAIFVSDGRKVVVNGVLCRLVEDHHIRLRIPSPDAVF